MRGARWALLELRRAALAATAPCTPDAGPSAAQSFAAEARGGAGALGATGRAAMVGGWRWRRRPRRLHRRCWARPTAARLAERPAGAQPAPMAQPELRTEAVRAAPAL